MKIQYIHDELESNYEKENYRVFWDLINKKIFLPKFHILKPTKISPEELHHKAEEGKKVKN